LAVAESIYRSARRHATSHSSQDGRSDWHGLAAIDYPVSGGYAEGQEMAFDTSESSAMDATAQAELVHRKELTPLELVDAAIARIERVNLTLNAMIILSSARARERYGSVLTIRITIRPGLRVSWKWRKS
jgi:hypothetical protein